ncbi:unnamed protein product [Cunninghamella echinulata]
MLLTRRLKLITPSSLLSQQLQYRPLLNLHNIKDHEWQYNWSPSEYQPFQPPPLPTTATNTQPTTSSTRTITFNISKIDGELHVIPDDIVGYDQVVDYLSAMQQKYTQMEQQKKRERV